MLTLQEVRKALMDPDPVTRKVAIDRVVELNAPDAFDLIMPFLKDPVVDVRASAIFNLGELKDPRALPHLLKLAREAEEEVVRAEALRALGEFRHPDVSTLLIDEIQQPKRSRMARQESARQLRHYDSPEAVEALKRVILEDEDAWARELAAESLYTINRPSLIQTWNAAVSDNNPDVVRYARLALVQLGVKPGPSSDEGNQTE
ncbi:HEAT repeat domain-containing protein [Sorangium sp. So ce1151]|uniref:HEAT repeat domain-containing protein n=1 Tax=Sorangium sp. So ce1151 TaxID=3133332 RepID=UPI003F5E8884